LKRSKNNHNSWLMLLVIGLILALILTACGESTITSTDSLPSNYRIKPAQIVSTTDGGVTWNSIYTNTAGGPFDFRAISCPTADNCFVWSNGGQLSATYDAGNHWGWRGTVSSSGFGIPSNTTPDQLICPDYINCYLLNWYSIHGSYDGGANWEEFKLIDLRGARFRSISCPGAKTCFVVGTNGLITTTIDGGKTWTKQTSGSTGELTSVSCTSLTTCIVTGVFPSDKNRNNGIATITSDAGKTWNTQYSSLISNLSTVTCPGIITCYAIEVSKVGGSDKKVFATKDGGKNWQDKSPAVTTLGTKISCPNITTCYIANIKELVTFTINGGNSWVSKSIGLPRELRDIACVSSTSCFVLAAKDEG